ncbi:MAG: VWA domain-containing protein [Acidobacteriaceae bacterium]|nr:VWA domain-containing protein [Acidobacteriaceae bacterium]
MTLIYYKARQFIRIGLSAAVPLVAFAHSEPVIRSTTQLVEVTVVVTGPGGAPVLDLKRKDFALWERGIARSISAFHQNWTADDEPTSPPAPTLGRYSNSIRQEMGGMHSVLLLDALDTPGTDWERAWPDVVRFIGGLGSADRIAIYSLDPLNGLEVLQDFDDDPRRLAAKLQKLPHATLAELLPAAAAFHDRDAPGFATRDSRIQLPELLSLGRVQGLTNALNAIANHLAGVPGRKTLIWFASVFPDPFPTTRLPGSALPPYRSKLLLAVNRLLSNDIGIYPVDARGLMPDHSFDAENRSLPAAEPVGPGQVNSMQVYDFSGLMELARRSGGKAYFNSNGFAQDLRDAAFAERSSYTLGFYLQAEPDGKYHPIRLAVDRPQVHLRYRPGYWAFGEAEAAGEAERQTQLRAAMDSPFMANAIQLQADAQKLSGNPATARTVIYIDPGNLTLEAGQGAWNARLEVLIGQKETRGRVFAIPPYSVPLSVPNSLLRSHGWLTTRATVALRPATGTIRVVVQDQHSGRIGSLDIPLDPAPGRR